MPEMTIVLRRDAQTGRQDIIVKLHGDEELLPNEHEQLHQRLVDQLIEGGLLRAGEGGRLVIEREESAVPGASPTIADDDRRAVGESG